MSYNRSDLFYTRRAEIDYGTQRKKHYLNLGYWQAESDTYEEACESLSELVGSKAELKEGDRVLDVGCGFGESMIFWLKKFGVSHVVGVTNSLRHAELARKNIREKNMQSKTSVDVSDALTLSYPDGSFDKVIALESAMHFDTRCKFLGEAARLLRPGGLLVVADVILREPKTIMGRIIFEFLSHYLSLPKENHISLEEYIEASKESGFKSATTESIGDHVFGGYRNYITKNGISAWPTIFVLKMALKHLDADYVILTARK